MCACNSVCVCVRVCARARAHTRAHTSPAFLSLSSFPYHSHSYFHLHTFFILMFQPSALKSAHSLCGGLPRTPVASMFAIVPSDAFLMHLIPFFAMFVLMMDDADDAHYFFSSSVCHFHVADHSRAPAVSEFDDDEEKYDDELSVGFSIFYLLSLFVSAHCPCTPPASGLKKIKIYIYE